MSVSRSGEAFDDGGDDTDDIDVPPGLEESMVEESIASGLPDLMFSSSEHAPVDAGQQLLDRCCMRRVRNCGDGCAEVLGE